MTEEDTFVRLSRASFDEVFHTYGNGLPGVWVFYYLISEREKKPPTWNDKDFPGWTWEEFQRECKRRIDYE